MLRALPPSYRQRALTEIEALIARAERDSARHDAARSGRAEARDRLRRGQRRLALLHRSREFLLSDEFSAVEGRRRH